MKEAKGGINRITKKQLFQLLLALIVFIILYRLGVPRMGHETGAALAVIVTGVLLWVLEPLPLSMTCLLIIFGFMVTGSAKAEVVLSGFSANSTFLILGGLMMAQGISNTTLAERAAYKLILRFGASPRKSLLALLLTMQFLALFIPATAVKATLMLPITYTLGKAFIEAGCHRHVHKMLLLGLAYGTHITALSVLPGAVGNVITAEMLSLNLGLEMNYTRWLAYFLPVSLVLIPGAWLILTWAFPAQEVSCLDKVDLRFQKELAGFGTLNSGEIRLIQILALTVLLWMTDFIHGWPTFVPALLAAVLMGLPGFGITAWKNILSINWENVILIGTIISMGLVFIDTGAAGYLSTILFPQRIIPFVLASGISGFILIGLMVRLYHLFIGNAGAMIIIMVPIVIELSLQAGIDPFYQVLITGASGLLAFLLIIQTMPGVIIYSTGEVTALDFLKAGVPLTLLSIFVVALAARFWWPLLQNLIGP